MTAYTTPKNWSVGETVTAAMMNTHVRDNIKYLEEQRAILAAYAVTKSLWIGSWKPRETDGATGPLVLTASPNYFDYLAFDPATAKYAWANVAMPVNWNGGTVTARFYWTHPATTVNFGVVWSIAATSMTSGENLATALGTAISVASTGGTTNYLYVSAATSAITIAGSPDDYHMVHFDIYRNVGHASDNMAVNAYLLGVMIDFGIA